MAELPTEDQVLISALLSLGGYHARNQTERNVRAGPGSVQRWLR